MSYMNYIASLWVTGIVLGVAYYAMNYVVSESAKKMFDRMAKEQELKK